MAGTIGAVAASVRQRGISLLGRANLPLFSSAAHIPGYDHGQKRGFVSKALRNPDFKRPAPYPYKQKPYTIWRALLDDTTQRFDENSKIIVIDGPPTGNKEKFGKQVADDLDMLYMPSANLDAFFINEYGYDLRQLNHKLPEKTRSFDIADFLQKPNHPQTTRMQLQLMWIRFNQYIEALNHLLNTGQGVVMNRSVYSDIAFMETLAECKFSAPGALDYYYEMREQGMVEFMRPHLVIYLDIPVDKVIENVKARGRPEEQNSPFYTPEVLTVLEKNYKQKYLRQIGEHAELLVYDWSDGGDAEVVVEDICRLDLEKYTKYDKNLCDWIFKDEWEWKYKRIMFGPYKYHMDHWMDIPRLSIPEIVIDGEELQTYNAIVNSSPGNRFDYGFNKDMGDKIWFKLKPDVKV